MPTNRKRIDRATCNEEFRHPAEFYRFVGGWVVQWSYWSGGGRTKTAAIKDLRKEVFATGRAPIKYWARRPPELRRVGMPK